MSRGGSQLTLLQRGDFIGESRFLEVQEGPSPLSFSWESKLHTRACLTQCIDEMVLESGLPHKIVNLLFTTTH